MFSDTDLLTALVLQHQGGLFLLLRLLRRLLNLLRLGCLNDLGHLLHLRHLLCHFYFVLLVLTSLNGVLN